MTTKVYCIETIVLENCNENSNLILSYIVRVCLKIVFAQHILRQLYNFVSTLTYLTYTGEWVLF